MTAVHDDYGTVAPRYYDRVYSVLRDSSGDAEFYRRLAHESGGPVLEVGCGTGRILLPIARDGLPCTGIDASPGMLGALRAKDPPARLRLIEAPMQDFDLSPERFALVFSAFRAFQHLYTVEDQLACLACVRRHLRPGGVFAFDVFAPALDRIATANEPEHEECRFTQDGEEVVLRTAIERDRVTQVQRVRMRWEWHRDGRLARHEQIKIRMRYYFRYELEHLLARAGFTTIDLYGGFDRRPYDYVSGETVVVAR